MKFVNLAVIVVEIAMLHGVLKAFQAIVSVPAAFIRREQFYGHTDRTGKRSPVAQERNHPFTVESAFRCDVDATAGMAIVVIDARGPGEPEFYRAQGEVVEGVTGRGAAAVGAGEDATAGLLLAA